MKPLPGGVLLAALLTASMAGIGHADAASTVYVSPTGSDANPGTSASAPLKTVGRAQQVVRSLVAGQTGDITVSLADGVYPLASTLSLGTEDSGTGGHSVVWTAAAGAHPVLSGGIALTGWTKSDAGKNIWSAPAPSTLDTRQLYVDGVRAQRASGKLPVTLTRTTAGYTASASTMAGWRNPADIEFVYRGGLGAWTEPRCPIGSMSGKTITMAQPCWNNSEKRVMRTDGSGRTYELVGRQAITESPTLVENAYELLDTPGEWYLDRAKHTVYYIPRSGENLATATVTVPQLEHLVTGNGVHDVAFNGIQFSYATWLQPNTSEGFSEIQANYTLTGAHGWDQQGLCKFVSGGTCPYGAWTKQGAAVTLTSDQNVRFTGDSFTHLGGTGLDLGTGSQHDLVKGSVFTDISGNGLALGGVDIVTPTAAQRTSDDQILDNHVYNVASEFVGGIGIDIGYVERATVSHNQIDHVPYTGISIGWGGWPDKVKLPAQPNYSNNNTLSNNLIFDHMQLLNDGAAIYTNGITGSSLATGEHITGNLFHDQTGKGHVIYSDNGASYLTITGNGVYSTGAANAWGSNHVDYTANDGNNDPLDIENNYWQNGAKDSSSKKVVLKNNHAITGASGVPASIVANAGIEKSYADILKWRPAA
jgi:hypothetical protein